MHRVFRRGLGLAFALSWPIGSALADPPFIPWSAILPGLTTTYEPTSANVCQSGQLACVDAVIAEMTTRFNALESTCHHAALFALTYLRTTEEYKAAVVEPGFFSDPAFINHQDANFAKQYFDAWDAYHGGNPAAAPRAWQIAFRASQTKQVNGTGSILLGMSAHVNRDLPFVLEAIGLVKPDGTSRKPDHDQVNVFLNRVVEPLFDEAAARYDPIVDDTQFEGSPLDEAALLQLLVLWRELAWRNAEALVSAPTPQARALVAAQIEQTAAIEANLIVVATSYSPLSLQQALAELTGLPVDPARFLQALADRNSNLLSGVLGTLLTPGATLRDRYCASHG
ncbi:MAG: hypothetical protein K0R38_6527 [Polyangiaceae bacterium]|jgi:hypothetical protein|nr:hypothetical protein [Polyangiaceae bacterium]